jgi:hypothetical protein
VEKIVVDSSNTPHVIRIKGADPEAVAEARRQLEYTIEEVDIPDRQVGWLVGKDGQRIADLQRKSGVIRIDVERGNPTAVLTITGLLTAVETAKLLVETELAYAEEARETIVTVSKLTEEMKTLELHYNNFNGQRRSQDEDRRGGGGGGGAGGGGGGYRGGQGGARSSNAGAGSRREENDEDWAHAPRRRRDEGEDGGYPTRGSGGGRGGGRGGGASSARR